MCISFGQVLSWASQKTKTPANIAEIKSRHSILQSHLSKQFERSQTRLTGLLQPLNLLEVMKVHVQNRVFPSPW